MQVIVAVHVLAGNFDVIDPLEWIARLTAHIPRKGAKQVIYYGAYSQAWRGRNAVRAFHRDFTPQGEVLLYLRLFNDGEQGTIELLNGTSADGGYK